MELNISKFNPIKASSYIPLPTDISRKKAVLNIVNKNDEECFKWSILAYLHSDLKNPNRVSNYYPFENELNFDGIDFPVSLGDISLFEKQNSISINVYGLEVKTLENGKEKSQIIGPFYHTNSRYNKHVDLLLLFDEETSISHYCLIKNMSRLISRQLSKHNEKKFLCGYCLNYFHSKTKYNLHIKESCDKVVTILPDDDQKIKFKNYSKSMKMPFIVYFDFESVLENLDVNHANVENKSYTHKTHKHVPYSFAYLIKCEFDDSLSIFELYNGPDAPKIFIERLERDVKRIYNEYLKHIIPMQTMNSEEKFFFKTAPNCSICSHPFLVEEKRVRHHCHMTGRFIGPAHNKCNVNCQTPNFIDCVAHNMAKYDTHLFIKNLVTPNSKMNVIAKSKENYISFSKAIQVENNTFFHLRFIDSFKFMSTSLDKLSKTLKDEQCVHVRNRFPNEDEFRLMRYKGVFPYSYLNTMDKLNETCLPEKSKFFNDLTNEHVSDEEYKRAQTVWEKFNIKTLGEYSDLYLTCDVLILCDLFQNFREVCLHHYELDPAHYLTAPSLSYDAMLKKTGVELELLSDIEMVHFFRKSIRGGFCQCSVRKAKANNPFVPSFDPSQKTSYLIYTDICNLYGYCMSQNLPHGGFKWGSPNDFTADKIQNLEDNSNVGYVFEVDLSYPTTLHEKHNDFPFCLDNILPPNSRFKNTKLCGTFLPKKHYVLDYKILKQALSNGLILDQIHRVLEYQQSYWLKSYISLNAELRKLAKSDFEKDFFKLMVNCIYGKTLEAVHKHVQIKFCTKWEGVGGAEKLIANPFFQNFKIFTETFAAVQLRKSKINYNKPLYVGFSILEHAKYHMYNFFYEYLKKEYGDNVILLYTDTDSFIFLVFTENFYEDIKKHYFRYDTSNFSLTNQFNIDRTTSEIGKMKIEYGERLLFEFLGTGAKAYFVDVEGESIKKAKGVQKNVVKQSLHKSDYEDIVDQRKNEIFRGMKTFKSILHEIYTIYTNKVSLNYFDDKRYLLPSSYSTLAWGHKDIPINNNNDDDDDDSN